MKTALIIGGIIIAVVIVLVLIAALFLGLVHIPGFSIPRLDTDRITPGDEDAPPGAINCDFTDMQLLDMIETVSGKDLNNAIGISYIRALNMDACGSNDENALDIAAFYRSLYSDWYLSDILETISKLNGIAIAIITASKVIIYDKKSKSGLNENILFNKF